MRYKAPNSLSPYEERVYPRSCSQFGIRGAVSIAHVL